MKNEALTALGGAVKSVFGAIMRIPDLFGRTKVIMWFQIVDIVSNIAVLWPRKNESRKTQTSNFLLILDVQKDTNLIVCAKASIAYDEIFIF